MLNGRSLTGVHHHGMSAVRDEPDVVIAKRVEGNNPCRLDKRIAFAISVRQV